MLFAVLVASVVFTLLAMTVFGGKSFVIYRIHQPDINVTFDGFRHSLFVSNLWPVGDYAWELALGQFDQPRDSLSFALSVFLSTLGGVVTGPCMVSSLVRPGISLWFAQWLITSQVHHSLVDPEWLLELPLR